MPKRGYTTITIKEDVYRLIQKIIIKENYEAGYMKWKSVSEFVDYIIREFAKEKGLLKEAK